MKRGLIAFVLTFYLGSASGDEVRLSAVALNLRNCPGTESCSVIRTLPPNSELEVIGRRGDWLQVRTEKDTGWVHSRYTSVKGASGTTMVTDSFEGLQGKSGKVCKFDELGDCVDIGRVDQRGNVFKFVDDSYEDQKVGFVNRSGKIYRISEGFEDDEPVGSIDKRGQVHRIVSPFYTGDEELVGVVRSDGSVYKIGELGDDELVGQVKAPIALAGGPALLLLLEEPQ